MRAQRLRAPGPDPEPKQRPRRSISEIRAELDAISAEYQRIHGRPLLKEDETKPRRSKRIA